MVWKSSTISEISQISCKSIKAWWESSFFIGHIILDEVFNIVDEFSLNNNNTNYNLSLKIVVDFSG